MAAFLKEESQIPENSFGSRMIHAGLITEEQRLEIANVQECLKHSQDKWMRFGDIAVSEGFCVANDIEEMPGYFGQSMIDAGLITKEEQQSIADWQNRLRKKGFNIRYGDIAVNEGFCTQKDVVYLLNS